MSDTPVPETLETIAARIQALIKSNDERFAKVDHHLAPIDQQFAKIDERFRTIDQQFDKVDQQFAKVDQQFAKVDQQFVKVDQQFAEMRAQLGVKIEAVDEKVAKVYDVLIAMRDEAERNAAGHTTFSERLDNHDVRILALEKPRTPNA